MLSIRCLRGKVLRIDGLIASLLRQKLIQAYLSFIACSNVEKVKKKFSPLLFHRFSSIILSEYLKEDFPS